MAQEPSESPSPAPSFLKRTLQRQVLPATRAASSLRNSAVQIKTSLNNLRALFKATREQASEQSKADKDIAPQSDAERFEYLYKTRNWTPQALLQQKRSFKFARWLSLSFCWMSVCGFIANAVFVDNLYGLVFGCVSLLLLSVCMAAKAFQCALYEAQIQERSLFNAAHFLARKDLLRLLFS